MLSDKLQKKILRHISVLILLLTGLTLETAGASPPQNNYTVTNGDTTCIVMTAGIQLTIPYPGQTQVSKTVFCLKSYKYIFMLSEENRSARPLQTCLHDKSETTDSIKLQKGKPLQEGLSRLKL